MDDLGLNLTEIATPGRTFKADPTLGLVGPRPSRLPAMVSSLGGARAHEAARSAPLTVHRYTLPVGLLFFNNDQDQQTNLLMAGVTLSVFPMIFVFLLLQRHLVKGIQLGAVKG